jgi:hypothetical protein
MEAILYKTDGTKKKIKISTFIEARGIVCNYDPNGLAEIVSLNDGNLFMIDEDGKSKNYSINKTATSIAHLHEAIYPHDNIVGDVLLFEDENEFEEMEYGFE